MQHDSDGLGGWNQVREGTKGGSNEWRQVRSSEDANRLGHVRVAPTGVDEAAVTLVGTRSLRVWVLGGREGGWQSCWSLHFLSIEIVQGGLEMCCTALASVF